MTDLERCEELAKLIDGKVVTFPNDPENEYPEVHFIDDCNRVIKIVPIIQNSWDIWPNHMQMWPLVAGASLEEVIEWCS